VSELNNGGLASAGPSVLGCALAFARRGHAVLLLYGITDGKCDCGKDCGKNAGKHPHHACPNGVHSAITDQDVIRGWFAKYPTSNYGICTDTLPTVDIDPRNGGDRSWRDLVRNNYDVVGWRVRTGGGGEHIMFGTISAPLPSCVLAKGVEVQSAGKYIVGVGSLHLSGKRYIWDKSAMPERDQMSPSAPPPWLVTLITESKVKPKAVRSPRESDAFADYLLEPAANGNRHSKYCEGLGHLLGSKYPHRGLLICLWDEHVENTWDVTDFDECERRKMAEDIIRKDDLKRGVA
jgi:Bifunctional DNA primase/polymerase, N-terminal